MSTIPRSLTRLDLVLLKLVAIVNINNVPPVAVYGWTSLALWGLAFLTFWQRPPRPVCRASPNNRRRPLGSAGKRPPASR